MRRNCPNCKVARKATKRLSLSRLPPILMIHLKRFSFKGPFTDKLETLVEFPVKGLDLTNYMPAPLPPGMDKYQAPGQSAVARPDDPTVQLPPYRYELYAVTNHFGTLTSGHCESALQRLATLLTLWLPFRYVIHRFEGWMAIL
jgi:ubiquitin carboxyl-terminal hydrolase 8